MRSRTIHCLGSGAALGIVLAFLTPKAEGQVRVTEIASETAQVDIVRGRGKQVTLPEAATDVFIAAPNVANVTVTDAKHFFLFGNTSGDTTLIASNAKGVMYSAVVHVTDPVVDKPINKQVNLQVRFVEVRRSFSQQLGINLLTSGSNGFQFGTPSTATNIVSGRIGLGGGFDILATIQAAVTSGDAHILANPSLTTISGQEGKFLAGGEVPIPQPGGLGATGITYKPYGVSLTYAPVVLPDGRISVKLAPEVSQLDYANGVSIQGTRVPGTTNRRAETVVELRSGQSMMIGGLLMNTSNNSNTRTPLLGDLPILGALFRSKQWQREETELVVIITPYLVKPTDGPLETPK